MPLRVPQLCLVLLATSAFADSYSVSGRVRDRGGEPVPHALVQLVARGAPVEGKADRTGRFAFTLPSQPGEAELHVLVKANVPHEWFPSATVSARLRRDVPASITVSLDRRALKRHKLEAPPIEGARHRSPAITGAIRAFCDAASGRLAGRTFYTDTDGDPQEVATFWSEVTGGKAFFLPPVGLSEKKAREGDSMRVGFLPLAVNGDGIAAGFLTGDRQRAVALRSGKLLELPLPDETCNSLATAINRWGEIAGSVSIGCPAGIVSSHAIVWRPGPDGAYRYTLLPGSFEPSQFSTSRKLLELERLGTGRVFNTVLNEWEPLGGQGMGIDVGTLRGYHLADYGGDIVVAGEWAPPEGLVAPSSRLPALLWRFDFRALSVEAPKRSYGRATHVNARADAVGVLADNAQLRNPRHTFWSAEGFRYPLTDLLEDTPTFLNVLAFTDRNGLLLEKDARVDPDADYLFYVAP